jgi:hypothetical protein
VEYKNSLQYNNIRGIDLGIDHICQLLFRKKPENPSNRKRRNVMAHMKPILSMENQSDHK